MKAIIIEDEFHPREMLVTKLRDNHPDIEVVASCENAETGLLKILQLHPDLIFLDIQMPEHNGIWLAEQISELSCESFRCPGIIFTTAYTDSEYLLKAFKLAAIDYLVKPVGVEALAKAIEKFKSKRDPQASAENLVKVMREEQLLHFKDYSGILMLREEDIICIKADGNYSVLTMLDGKTEDVFERIGEIEKRMPVGTFMRAGKSLIINRKYIRKINVKKSAVQLATDKAAIEVGIPESVVKELKNSLPRL
ncbi:MAG: LytTR family DNA-binding domain-containing protein [Tannerella sp.]|jgi:two-component system LytT family response regulator|nr:LytTR family DNA-binding domain-containing protein [Tannerella sp.]